MQASLRLGIAHSNSFIDRDKIVRLPYSRLLGHFHLYHWPVLPFGEFRIEIYCIKCNANVDLKAMMSRTVFCYMDSSLLSTGSERRGT